MLKIKKVYISKLFVKYYDYLKTQTSFFQDFPAVQAVACTEQAMLTYLNTLDHNYMYGLFLSNFFQCLYPLFIPYAKRKY